MRVLPNRRQRIDCTPVAFSSRGGRERAVGNGGWAEAVVYGGAGVVHCRAEWSGGDPMLLLQLVLPLVKTKGWPGWVWSFLPFFSLFLLNSFSFLFIGYRAIQKTETYSIIEYLASLFAFEWKGKTLENGNEMESSAAVGVAKTQGGKKSMGYCAHSSA